MRERGGLIVTIKMSLIDRYIDHIKRDVSEVLNVFVYFCLGKYSVSLDTF